MSLRPNRPGGFIVQRGPDLILSKQFETRSQIISERNAIPPREQIGTPDTRTTNVEDVTGLGEPAYSVDPRCRSRAIPTSRRPERLNPFRARLGQGLKIEISTGADWGTALDRDRGDAPRSGVRARHA